MSPILSPGEYLPIPQGYRLIQKQRTQGQKVAFFGPFMCELGQELLTYRPLVINGIKAARETGYHVVVSGKSNRHPLYMDADEYWGVASPNSYNSSGLDRTISEIFGEVTQASGTVFMNRGPSYPSAIASKRAEDRANDIVKDKRFITLCPRYNGGAVARNFPHWQEVVDGIKDAERSLDIICTSLKEQSYALTGVRYLQDIVGIENFMDVEIYLHRRALCCVASNTGTVGIFIYGLAHTAVLIGGTGGHEPGWHGLRDLVAKENNSKPTRLVLSQGEYIFREREESMRCANTLIGNVVSIIRG